MASRTTINISLTPELGNLIATKVKSGLYQSASEVVREALRRLQQDDLNRHSGLEELRRQIAIGLEQARRGELHDGEAAFDELERQGHSRSRLTSGRRAR